MEGCATIYKVVKYVYGVLDCMWFLSVVNIHLIQRVSSAQERMQVCRYENFAVLSKGLDHLVIC